MNIEIIKCTSLLPFDQSELVSAYQTVYSTRPWSEWKQCSICKKYWGYEKESDLVDIYYQHCGQAVQDYWTSDNLLKMFRDLSSSSLFSATIAFDMGLNKIIGFCWGSQIETKDLNGKFKTLNIQSIVESITDNDKAVVNIAEVAVDSDYRGKGVASRLLQQFVEQNSENGWFIAETKGGLLPSLTNSWFKKLGFQTIALYNDARQREVQFIEISKLI